MWQNPQETADLVTFTKEILNWKLHFLCSVSSVAIIDIESKFNNKILDNDVDKIIDIVGERKNRNKCF